MVSRVSSIVFFASYAVAYVVPAFAVVAAVAAAITAVALIANA